MRRRSIYGRRQGHKLRPRRRALFEKHLPALQISLDDVEAATDAPSALDPCSLFQGEISETWLEIGFGAGEHIVHQLKHHPTVGMIGCEPFVNGVANLIACLADDTPVVHDAIVAGDASGLGRLRIFMDDARLLLPALADASIARLFVLHPDPWPKTRHNKRRIVQPATIDQFARVLRDGGELRMATDTAPYVRWMLFHMLDRSDFTWTARNADDWRRRRPDWPETRYDAKARAEGRNSTYLRFKRVARAAHVTKHLEGVGESEIS